MGYRTKYTLNFSGIPRNEDYKVAEALTTITGYHWDTCFEQEVKWYDHLKDMRVLSERFPDILFVLEGEGEESGDIWKQYHKNGKVQEVKVVMTFEDFDESKLK